MNVTVTCGIFDLFHRGHVALLERMRDLGDLTVAVVHDDETCWELKHKLPIQNVDARCMNLIRSGLVDGVTITHRTDPGPDFTTILDRYTNAQVTFARGDDMPTFPGRWALEASNIPIVLIPYTPHVSSTWIRDQL